MVEVHKIQIKINKKIYPAPYGMLTCYGKRVQNSSTHWCLEITGPVNGRLLSTWPLLEQMLIFFIN